MALLTETLDDAAKAGIVSSEQRDRLHAFFAERGLIDTGLMAGLPGAAQGEAVEAEASESPRFVRGFHDVLITIGVLAALGGLWGLAPFVTGISDRALSGSALVLPAIILLAELLVRRQRLALPAFVLTGFYSVAIVTLIGMLIEGFSSDGGSAAGAIVFFASPILLLPFYLRYRVPVALAAMMVMAGLFVFLLVNALLGVDLGNASGVEATISVAVALVCALALFAAAMAFDMSDPARVTRRSDVAFWLHLAAAPALLFTVFALVMGTEKGLWWASDPGMREAVIAIVLVAVMMMVGIVIDRRAFVTAGLISLGVAVGTLVTKSGIGVPSITAFAVFSVGIVVLVLGVGWQRLRRAVVTLLPDGLRARLRPV